MPTYPKGKKFITKVTVPKTVDPRGRISRMTETEAQGQSWELAVQSALKLGKPLPEPESKPAARVVGGVDAGTVSNCYRSANQLVWGPQGDSSAKQALNGEIFMRWCGPNMSAREAFEQDNVNKFIEYLKTERRVSNNTINKYCSAVRQMMRFAKVEREPMLPWYEVQEGRVRVFSDEEKDMITRQWRLWQKHREADFFVFQCHTGGRPYIDSVRLHWTNVFAPQKNTPGAVHFIKAKGGNPRTVPLTPEAWEAVSRQDRTSEGPWSWATNTDMRRLWDRTISAFPQLRDAVFYCTRHTFGTELYRRSRDIKLVKDMMGHKNYKTTEIYVHIVGDDSHARVADLMSGRPLTVLVP
jgi:integrase